MTGTTVLRKARRTPYEVIHPESESADWIRFAACGSLVVGGILLLTGKKRAGLVAAASGTALAMLDHEESISRWWSALPRYIGQARSVIDHVQEAVDKISDKSQSVRRVLGR
jgi:hypothetical protein